MPLEDFLSPALLVGRVSKFNIVVFLDDVEERTIVAALLDLLPADVCEKGMPSELI